jgi:polysaccharide pyruvyl transferase CsaB
VQKTLKFAVSGYYGCGNAGDEAVLAGIRAAFVQRAGNRPVQLTALSQDPENTKSLHGIAAEYRMSRAILRRTIGESDMLISGGGSLLQDTTSVRSLLYYLWVCRVALSMKRPVMFYAQGIGPLHRTLSQKLVRMVANRAALLTVRDPASADLLRRIGVTNPKLEVTADPAFALKPAPKRKVEDLLIREAIPEDAPLIGVALRPWGGSGESPVANYARLLDLLAQRGDAHVALLPMHVPDDVEFAEQVVARTADPDAFLIVRNAYPPAVLLGLVARMQAVVAMRLHALIFAARAEALPFALSYDPKVEHLMRGLGLEDALEDWRTFNPEAVAERVVAMLADYAQRSAALHAQLPDLEQRALRNAELALNLFT